MRNFIVSDLHGNGNVYNIIMNYLENINKEEPVTLYINGDLIDRGPDSASMLLDVMKRTKEGPFKVKYLAGSHELLMHQFFLDKERNTKEYHEDWFDNGGMSTYYDLEEKLGSEDRLDCISSFISNLKIYHKFDEKINGKNIVVVHAACPTTVKDKCDIKLKDNNEDVYFALLSRSIPSYFPFRCKIGNPNYFTIVGHTPNYNEYGINYNYDENYLNIDGASSRYVSGDFTCDHVPLVEVCDGYLKIISFNNKNEIIDGCFLNEKQVYPFSGIELKHDKKYIDKSIKVKKLVKNEDGVVYYNE